MRISVLVFAAATFCIGSVAMAQTVGAGIRYRWVDAKGLPHYSDGLTSEAINNVNGYDVIDDGGHVAQHVPRPMTPAERAVADQKAAAQAAQDKAAADQARADNQMLNAYPDEASLKGYQQGVLGNLDQQMKSTQANLRSQDAALTDLLNRAADNERAKHPVPKFLTDQIAQQRNIVANEHVQLTREQANRDAAVQAQAKQLQHYRDLKAAQAKQDGT